MTARSQVSSYSQKLPNVDLKSESIDIYGNHNIPSLSCNTLSQLYCELLLVNDDLNNDH